VLGVIENMSGFICPHCNKETAIFSMIGGRRMAEELGITFLGFIPIDPHFVAESDCGKALIETDSKIARTVLSPIIDKLLQS
jgi:hypothetical protein